MAVLIRRYKRPQWHDAKKSVSTTTIGSSATSGCSRRTTSRNWRPVVKSVHWKRYEWQLLP
jgi:hypothetical protein